MHSEIALFPYDADKAYDSILDCIENGYVVLAYRNGELAGSIGLQVMAYWYSTTEFVGEKWTFVRTNHRNSHIAAHLVKQAKDVAAKMGMYLFIDIFSDRQAETKNRLFRRYLTPVGEKFMWRPEDGMRRRDENG